MKKADTIKSTPFKILTSIDKQKGEILWTKRTCTRSVEWIPLLTNESIILWVDDFERNIRNDGERQEKPWSQSFTKPRWIHIQATLGLMKPNMCFIEHFSLSTNYLSFLSLDHFTEELLKSEAVFPTIVALRVKHQNTCQVSHTSIVSTFEKEVTISRCWNSYRIRIFSK